MKKIEAFIRHEAFEPIRTELLDKGFPSLSILEAKGSGRQKGIVEQYRGSTLTVNVRPKLKLEVVIEDKDKAIVVETILKHARSGEVGDGKIFVLPVEEAIRIRTGEDGEPVPVLASNSMAGEERITLGEAARRSGVSSNTLKRWAADKVVPVRRGRWTAAAAAQARVVARMRERGHSLEELDRRVARAGSPSGSPRTSSRARRAGHGRGRLQETGLEPELIERILVILGTPIERERVLNPEDVEALRHCARVLARVPAGRLPAAGPGLRAEPAQDR